MEITPIGLRSLEGSEISKELRTGAYEPVDGPAPSRHVELEAFIFEMKRENSQEGVEVMTCDPISTGQNVFWRGVCPGLSQLVRVIGTVVSCQPSRVAGWRNVRVKPRYYNRYDLEAAGSQALPSMSVSKPSFAFMPLRAASLA